MSHPSPRDRCAPQAPAALVSKHSRPTRMALFKASAVCGNCVALTRKVLLTNTYTCMRLSFGKVNADWDEFRPLPRYLARKCHFCRTTGRAALTTLWHSSVTDRQGGQGRGDRKSTRLNSSH